MELRHLKYFRVLADELHFGNAASKLFIAQPPLSRQIRELEEELGAKLFNRTKRHVELTPAGQYLKSEVKNLFYQVENMRREISEIGKGASGQLKIGYVGAAMHSVLPEILSNLRDNYPNLRTILYEMGNEEQEQAIAAGQLDVGFVRVDISNDLLIAEKILEETFSVIISQKHPLAQSKNLDLKKLVNEPFISFSSQCGRTITDSINSICNRAGFTPRTAHETSQINTIVRLVESGIGYSIVPTSTKEAYNLNVRFHELKKYPERVSLYMLYTKASCKYIKNLLECTRLD